MSRFMLLALTPFLLFSCGKDYGKRKIESKEKAAEVTKPAVPFAELQGKTEDTFLKIKYEKYELTCNLYVQAPSKISKTVEPDDTISIDLINDYKQTNAFILKAEKEDRTVEFKFHVREFSTIDVEFKLDDGQIITAKFSPKLNVQFRYVTYKNEAERLDLEKNYDFFNREMLVLEKKTNLAIENPSVDEKVFKKPDVVNCSVASVLKAAYADQYKLGK